MIQVTSHILDTARGIPAAGITVVLYQQHATGWGELGREVTNTDGRVAGLTGQPPLPEGRVFKLAFDTRTYFDQLGVPSFYPVVEIIFETRNPGHYHVPLLLNPFGYTTYRGS